MRPSMLHNIPDQKRKRRVPRLVQALIGRVFERGRDESGH